MAIEEKVDGWEFVLAIDFVVYVGVEGVDAISHAALYTILESHNFVE